MQKRFSDHGWVPQDFVHDLGEDILVQIYDDGRPAGLSFNVQAKSTHDGRKVERKRGYVAYPIDSLNLRCWEGSNPVTIIVLWDMSSDRGWWVSADDVVKDLDARAPRWRTGTKEPTVRFPLENMTDDLGLRRLRFAVASHAFPTVARGRGIEIGIQLAFDKTPEGLSRLDRVNRAIKDGGAVRIDAANLKVFETSPWFDRLTGGFAPDWVELHPVVGDSPLPIRLTMEEPNGARAEVPYLELRRTQAGTERATFSNTHEAATTQVEVRVDRAAKELTFCYTPAQPRVRIADALDALRFRRAFLAGGTLRMTTLKDGRQTDIAVGRDDGPPLNPRWFDLAEKLCTIHQRTNTDLWIGPDWSLDAETANTIDWIHGVCTTGRFDRRNLLLRKDMERGPLTALLDGLRQTRADYYQEVHTPIEKRVDLLGASVSLGTMSSQVLIGVRAMTKAIETSLATNPMDTLLFPVEVRAALFLEEYRNFLPSER